MAAEKNLILDGAGLSSKLKSEGQEIISLNLKPGFDLRKESLEPYSNVGLFWFLASIVISEAKQFILSGDAQARSPDALVG